MKINYRIKPKSEREIKPGDWVIFHPEWRDRITDEEFLSDFDYYAIGHYSAGKYQVSDYTENNKQFLVKNPDGISYWVREEVLEKC